ncbi:hypothetical protein [Actinokineospora diospyrosa]|uniref:Uncharacterized protein n=1 Tax=Actinokineospora diospyrosa TaxID=103728 RepID=A0ABT1IBU5_9PSEU|nr:hypothetical protein [Actinokineospora diospyrosa]MCP2270101.1 hypothetical protein [Actinokineospora diospyrosa]
MPPKIPGQPPMPGGRRIYIHTHSLKCLARRSEEIANTVSAALATIRIAKVIHHHVEMGVDIGLVRPRIGEEFAVAFEWKTELAHLFHAVGYRPCFPSDRSLFLPLLGPNETVVATCSEQGYYTFATDTEASTRMFEDHEPFPTLQRSLSAEEGPDDLTMIRGVSLALINPEIGTGQVGYRYAPDLKAYTLSDQEVDHINSRICARSIEETQAKVARLSPHLTDDEAQICRDMLSSVERTFAVAEKLSMQV